MARMSREFKLVLLGAGLLTAGFFLWPSEDAAAAAAEDGPNGQAGGGGTSGRRVGYGHVFIVTSYSRASTARVAGGGGGVSAPRTAAVSRGGFGSSGVGFSGG